MCTPATPGCSAGPGATRRTPLPDQRSPVDVLGADDPVAAALDAVRTDRTLLLRTSGTSGTARGVVRTAGSWASSFAAVSELFDVTEASRVWVPGPLTATMNLFAAVHALHAGASLVDRAVDATHAVLTPAALDRILAAGPSDLLRGLRVLVAGDRLELRLHDRAVAAGLEVAHYYGAAELSFVAWGPHADHLHPFPGVEVDSQDGTLWARSQFLAQGYRGDPGPFTVGPDGFGTVGDLGEVRDGRVVVHGRGDEAVTTAGATVLVADVERVLRPAASGELLVVPAPHPSLGAIVGCVLTNPGDRAALTEVARTRLDQAARPRLWFHLAQLPVGLHGKADRAAVRELVAAGRLPRMA